MWPTIITFSLDVGFIAAVIGWHMGASHATARHENEKDNAGAAACPTCGVFNEPAERLESVCARVSGVEWFGHRDPGSDPVEDANWILRVAISHARRVRIHQNTKAVVMHREAKHRDANGDRIDS